MHHRGRNVGRTDAARRGSYAAPVMQLRTPSASERCDHYKRDPYVSVVKGPRCVRVLKKESQKAQSSDRWRKRKRERTGAKEKNNILLPVTAGHSGKNKRTARARVYVRADHEKATRQDTDAMYDIDVRTFPGGPSRISCGKTSGVLFRRSHTRGVGVDSERERK